MDLLELQTNIEEQWSKLVVLVVVYEFNESVFKHLYRLRVIRLLLLVITDIVLCHQAQNMALTLNSYSSMELFLYFSLNQRK
jgi:hypothetical protein